MAELWEKVKPEDLDVSLSLGFIVRGTLKSFLELRDLIQKHLNGKNGEFLVYASASATELKLVKGNKEAIKFGENKKGSR